MKRLAFLAVVARLGGCALPGTGRAEFIITFSQNGLNVDANGTGTLNISALTKANSGGEGVSVLPSPDVFLIVGGAGQSTFYDPIAGPTSIGPGTTLAHGTGSGDLVGVDFNPGGPVTLLFVPQSYMSGASLSDSATWHNTTISGLGLAPGTYTWTWGSAANGTADDLKVVIPSAAAPEPASLTLLGIGGAGLVGYGWRRRKRAA
jgi:hypothetical protein